VRDIPAGSRIVTNEDTVELSTGDHSQTAVLQPNTNLIVGEFTDQVVLGLESGGVSVNAGDLQNGQVQTPYNVAINLAGESMDVAIDPDSDDVTADCFSGDCTITDDTGKERAVNTGESITFNGNERDFDTADVIMISGPIVFTSFRHSTPEIYTMNADGSNQTRLTNNSVSDFEPAWSPDGRRIAFVSSRDNNNEIYSMKSDGSDVTRLTNEFAQDELPAWSPDGRYILFVSTRDNNEEIYLMNANGTDMRRLTNQRLRDTEPTWSPDGRKIAFVSTRGGDEDIYILDLDDPEAEPVNLTQNPAADSAPAWSPDGNSIAFVSTRNGANDDLYVMDLTTGAVTQLTDNAARDTEPSWSPDGTQIVFMSQRAGNNEVFKLTVANPANPVDLSGLQATADQEPNWLPLRRAGQ
jgi:dipeptidyl aminopeptidase/acylaminoacyl peptidase